MVLADDAAAGRAADNADAEIGEGTRAGHRVACAAPQPYQRAPSLAYAGGQTIDDGSVRDQRARHLGPRVVRRRDESLLHVDWNFDTDRPAWRGHRDTH